VNSKGMTKYNSLNLEVRQYYSLVTLMDWYTKMVGTEGQLEFMTLLAQKGNAFARCKDARHVFAAKKLADRHYVAELRRFCS